MHILILYLVLEFCRIKNFTQFLMYFLSIKNFKHLHEKVLERNMHARMQNSYARDTSTACARVAHISPETPMEISVASTYVLENIKGRTSLEFSADNLFLQIKINHVIKPRDIHCSSLVWSARKDLLRKVYCLQTA